MLEEINETLSELRGLLYTNIAARGGYVLSDPVTLPFCGESVKEVVCDGDPRYIAFVTTHGEVLTADRVCNEDLLRIAKIFG